ncbi:MAG TPA: hypothetical protein QF353_02765 [Gammaproteobacteria bacterium]|nr:hypothetical protein [Gammaproteobacteria bacterium]
MYRLLQAGQHKSSKLSLSYLYGSYNLCKVPKDFFEVGKVDEDSGYNRYEHYTLMFHEERFKHLTKCRDSKALAEKRSCLFEVLYPEDVRYINYMPQDLKYVMYDNYKQTVHDCVFEYEKLHKRGGIWQGQDLLFQCHKFLFWGSIYDRFNHDDKNIDIDYLDSKNNQALLNKLKERDVYLENRGGICFDEYKSP